MVAALGVVTATAPAAWSAAPDTGHLAESVNTFIGSQKDGNTFPGASAPFGMTQISPIGNHYAGWHYDDPKIKGFGHTFLSGAGCWEQGGQVSVLPTTGAVGPGAAFDTTKPATFDQDNYAASYTHDGEVGQAGYYRTALTSYGGITAESTATTRTGLERYTFGDGKQGNVFVNVGQATIKHPSTASAITVVDDHTLRGSVRAQAFCGGPDYTIWFETRFDRPFASFGTWDPSGGQAGRGDVSGAAGLRGAWLTFDTSQQHAVTATTAISYVDAHGATTNLDRGALPFDVARTQVQQQWESELGRVRVAARNADDKTVFYTALYHVLLQPMVGNDADGRYRGFDDKTHQADGWTYYQFYSLWDTYRTQNQLLSILRPSVAADIAKSVLAIHAQGGWLPRWAYANHETNTMTGDPVTPFLVDLWRFGALKGHEQEAYQALLQNVDGIPPAASPFQGRAGNDTYLKHGFVQYDPNFPKKGQDVDPAHGGSATEEYALADCSLSVMAKSLGRNDDAARLSARGQNWKNLWDPTVKDADRGFTGFFRPKNADGSWVTPYEPISDKGFHEGTAWQYQWLTQQDVPGVVAAMGGRDQVAKRLDTLFSYDKVVADPAGAARTRWVFDPYTYYGVYQYNPNNEPDLHTPWYYSLIGQPWKTSAVVHAQQTLFTNAPTGVTGNDDLGEMSAWYVMGALGMYPVMPGTGQFVLNAPRFASATIVPERGRPITLSAPGADSGKIQYIAGVRTGNAEHPQVWVDWDQLSQGGTISYTLTDTAPSSGWGTSPAAAPGSPCATGGRAGW